MLMALLTGKLTYANFSYNHRSYGQIWRVFTSLKKKMAINPSCRTSLT
jgi:hypothetical protein